MDALSRRDLKSLMEHAPGTCLSMYMPTYKAGAETRQNPIRYKNLLRQAEEHLQASSLSPEDIQTFLEPLRPLAEDEHLEFWQHQNDGLAILRSLEMVRLYSLPLDFAECVVVGQQFHLKPLLPYLSGDGRFYVLALSQNDVRLAQCSRHAASEVKLDHVPKSRAEALRYDIPEPQVQYHTGGGGSHRSPMSNSQGQLTFHGHGGGTDSAASDILEYFRRVDRGLHEILHEADAPLVIAGVEYLHPLYREANTYPHLIEQGIMGNPEQYRIETLHEQAWPLVEPLFQQAQAKARAKYEQYEGTGLASHDLAAIVPAAYDGRIETLFVALDQQQWGTYDPATREVRMAQEAGATSEDLLNVAAIQTFLNSGTVYAVEPDAVPGQGPVAAVFRY
jgi:Bacterial archaeo-eukaryotic release factor family 3